MNPAPEPAPTDRGPGVRYRGMVSHYVRTVGTLSYRDGMRRARAGLDLPHRRRPEDPPHAVWAVTMVRNEADIIEGTVRHLLGQGVDRVLVADNGSTDETPGILRRLRSEGRTIVAQDREVGFFQAAKMTLLSRYAAEHGASWVVPFDADELWFAEGQSLGAFLQGNDRAAVARADVHNGFPCEDAQGRLRLELAPHALAKVAFRPHRLALLSMGNHWCSRAGDIARGLHVVHIPWRSEGQLIRKLRQGARAISGTHGEHGAGSHWRQTAGADDDLLSQMWRDVLAGRPNEPLEWSPTGNATLLVDPRQWKTWPTLPG